MPKPKVIKEEVVVEQPTLNKRQTIVDGKDNPKDREVIKE